MKTFLARLITALVLLLFAGMAWSIYQSRPLFEGRLKSGEPGAVPLAPREHALSFARFDDGARTRVLLVTAHGSLAVEGVDLGRRLGRVHDDPLQFYREFGYEALAAAVTGADIVSVPLAKLTLPFAASARNIGIGANYREHARESGIGEEPFVFPKIAPPTPFTSDVARAGSRLLDYEAELGLVALDDIEAGGDIPERMGLVLANELTDRWELVKNIERAAPMGTTGFAEGKSREGFACIGSVLVIPRDLGIFYRQIRLRLYVNGRLRQSESAGSMVWDPAQIIAEIFRRADWRFRLFDKTLSLLGKGGHIPSGTIIFSGTPAGVVFKPLNLWNPWLYLQPQDEVVIFGGPLGYIRNRIVD